MVAKLDGDGYDIFAEDFGADPHAKWAEVRGGGCPVAHSDKWGGSWLPTRYDDIFRIAQNPATFSTRAIEVAGPIPQGSGGFFSPPLTSGPAEHKAHRDVIAPYFTPARVAELEPSVREDARNCAATIAQRGGGEVVSEFARPVALGVLSRILGVPVEHQGRFLDWAVRVIRLGPVDQQVRSAAFEEAFEFLDGLFQDRMANPSDDLVSHISRASIDGTPLSKKHKLGTLMFVVLAGADTTWSALGASLLHLAQSSDDRHRLIAEPDLFRTTAVEELLRVYAPVTMARVAAEPAELRGRCIAAGDRVLLPFPAANRDPEVFDEPDQVRLDRKRNRHLTFGTGIHQCLGSHLARMELRVGLQEWLKVMPDFELASREPVAWSRGQVRGPESVRIRVVK
jgi:cytochrome P450